MLLIDDLISMPVGGLFAVFEAIHEQVKQEIGDIPGLQKKLLDLQLRFEMEEISEDDYNRQEKNLLALIDQARKMKDE